MQNPTFVFCATEFVNESADEFVRVAPYCDAPQVDRNGQRVIQRFTFESAKKLVEAFNTNAKRLLARLGFGSASVPFYNGHPDFANSPNGNADDERDTRVYAEAEALEAREDGLYAKIKRSEFLEDLKNALGKLEISPRWVCAKNAEDGTFNPVRLLSFGLVKRGNLPNADFINQKQEEELMTKEQLEQAGALLGLDAADVTPESLISAISALVKSGQDVKNAEAEAVAEKDKEKERADTAVADAEASKKEAEDEKKKRKDAEKELANFLIDKALSDGRLLPANKDAFVGLFETDFVNARTALECLPVHPDFANGAKAEAEAAAVKDEDERASVAMSRREAGKKLAEMANAKLAEMRKSNPAAEFIDALNSVVSTEEGLKLHAAANAIVKEEN